MEFSVLSSQFLFTVQLRVIRWYSVFDWLALLAINIVDWLTPTIYWLAALRLYQLHQLFTPR